MKIEKRTRKGLETRARRLAYVAAKLRDLFDPTDWKMLISEWRIEVGDSRGIPSKRLLLYWAAGQVQQRRSAEAKLRSLEGGFPEI